MKRLFLSLLIALTVTGCMRQADQTMQPLHYNGLINARVPKKAYLYQQPSGAQYSGVTAPNDYANSGLIGLVVGTTIESNARKNHPERYTYSYNEGQQAIFMDSFQSALLDNQVFNGVELTTNLNKRSPQDVLITIYFKSTRVLAEYNFKVVLDVVMTIQAKNKPTFKHTYLVSSDDDSYKSFNEQQTDASQKLLNQLVAGIEEWYSENYRK